MSRPCQSLRKASVRVLVHLTALPNFLAAQARMTYSGPTCPREPNPPPVSGQITLTLLGSTFNALAIIV